MLLWGLSLGNSSHRAHPRLGWVDEAVGRRAFHVTSVDGKQVERASVVVTEDRSLPAFAAIDANSLESAVGDMTDSANYPNGSTGSGHTKLAIRGRVVIEAIVVSAPGRTGAAVVIADCRR